MVSHGRDPTRVAWHGLVWEVYESSNSRRVPQILGTLLLRGLHFLGDMPDLLLLTVLVHVWRYPMLDPQVDVLPIEILKTVRVAWHGLV